MKKELKIEWSIFVIFAVGCLMSIYEVYRTNSQSIPTLEFYSQGLRLNWNVADFVLAGSTFQVFSWVALCSIFFLVLGTCVTAYYAGYKRGEK